MTFRQFDINFSRYKYILEKDGIFVSKRKLFSTSVHFFPFENVGAEIVREKELRLVWLVLSVLFFLVAIVVLISRMLGGVVGDGAEIFWLTVSFCFIIIYAVRKKTF